MAQRFGGKYSPRNDTREDAANSAPGRSTSGPDGNRAQIDHAPRRNPFRGRHRIRAGGRVNLLFFAPLPLAVRAFWQDPTGLALMLAAFGTLILAAWLTREGLLAQEAYEARKIARRPAIPRKIFGSVLTGAGLLLAGYATGHGLVGSVLFGVLGLILHVSAFGLDPLHNKGMEGLDAFQTDRVARAVGEGEAYLSAMADAIKRAHDRKMEARVMQFQSAARDLFRTVEEDPRDLTAARKYLTVYLMGARDATIKFADIQARSPNPQARADYAALLDDLEQNFAARTKALLLDDRSDLTVEIEVLRERLQREGVRSQ